MVLAKKDLEKGDRKEREVNQAVLTTADHVGRFPAVTARVRGEVSAQRFPSPAPRGHRILTGVTFGGVLCTSWVTQHLLQSALMSRSTPAPTYGSTGGPALPASHPRLPRSLCPRRELSLPRRAAPADLGPPARCGGVTGVTPLPPATLWASSVSVTFFCCVFQCVRCFPVPSVRAWVTWLGGRSPHGGH